MQFLAPLFLAALAALAVPILLHVRRQKPKERVPFSAVQFLDAGQPLQRRQLRLQDLLLLFLRCLAVALLAFAFARPFFGHHSTFAKSPPVQRLILLDTSASMRGEHFDRAKKEAERLVAKAGPDDLIAIAGFDRALSVALPFPHWRELPPGERRNAAVSAIQSLQAGWRETNFGHTWTAAADLLDQARDSNETPGVLHVISDFQRGAATGDLLGFEWPTRLQVVMTPIEDHSWTNAGVHPVSGQPGKGETAAAVANSAGSEDSAFRLAWNGGTTKPIEVAPGQTHIAVVPNRAVAEVAVVSGDSFPFDNTAWFAPAATATIAVDYFGPAKPDDTSDSLFFLSRALGSTPVRKIDLRVNPAPSAPPAAFSIIDGALPPPNLRSRLEAGASALLVLRDTSNTGLVDASLRITEVPSDEPALFGRIDFEDPVFQPFADPKFSNFSHVFTWHHRVLDAAQIPGAKVLAAFDSGDPALLRIPVGQGTLFVLTTTWRPADSQLALSSKFAPLLHSLLAQTPEFASPKTDVFIGEIVHLPSQVDGRVITPSGSTVAASNGLFQATDTPGIYRTTDNRFSFAVNLRASESELTPLSDAELKALGIPLEKISPAVTSEALRQAMAQEEIERRQKWWWWLILAAIAVFIAETAFAAWSSRPRTQGAPA